MGSIRLGAIPFVALALLWSAAVPQPAIAGSKPVALATADLDHDPTCVGCQDLVVGDRRAKTVDVYLGHGDGTFAAPKVLSLDAAVLAVATVDCDGDGDVDVLASTVSPSRALTVFVNQEQQGNPGKFVAAAALVPPWVGWTPPLILMFLVGLPAFALGQVAERERRARGEVERLYAELTGTLNRLQTAQEELVEAERMATVGRLSLKVAHEVRNPIAAIELNAELLGDMVQGRVSEDGTEATSLVTAIRDQVTALDALTEEYLAFARFPRPQFEEDSVNDMVTAVAEFVRPLAARQGVAVKVAIDPAVPSMEFDRTLLRQAVLNLLKNGLEAVSQGGGALTLTTSRVGETVEIAVTDSGPGISAEVGRRLFEQFFTTKPQGTGLGLAISRQIVEEHGGKIRWSSTPGVGATFTLALPIRKLEHA